MGPDLGQLETLYWVAQLGSFRAAAARLNLSQPTLSLRIKSWERDLGFPLFERRGRSVVLTEGGAAALEYADRIVSLAGDLNHKLGHRRTELSGQLRLGVPDTFALLCLSDLVSYLDATHPQLRVAITVDNSAVLSHRLSDGALDLCVLAEPAQNKKLRLEPLGAHKLVWIAQAGGKDATLRTRQQMAGAKILANPAPSNTFKILMDWFDEEDLVPSRVSTCNSISIILELVRQGTGISIVPLSAAAEDVECSRIVVLPINPPLPTSSLFVGYEKSSTNSAVPLAVEAVKRVVRERRFIDDARLACRL